MSPRKAAPIKDVEVLSDKKKIKLLMDPLRIAIMSVLGREPMTVKQIADELNRKPGTILHHLDRLKKAKLVIQVRTERTRTGIVQRYYRATAREYQIGVAKVVSSGPKLTEVVETPEDRWRNVVIGLAEHGIVIPESKMEHALELLRAMTKCEDEISRRVYGTEKSSMAPHIQAEVTRIMRRLALDQDNECSRIQEEWHRFLEWHRKK
ncbi:MAG: helix-turn-helix domain-containing protein [Candidatus Thorarchaeota archaeon]